MGRAVLVLAMLAAVARAQPAPTMPESSPPPPSPPAATSPPAAAAAQPQPPGMQAVHSPPSVMARRWAIALGFGTESAHASADVASPTIGLATFELAGHYRIRPAIELGLSLGGGGAYDGKFTSGRLVIDFRYRFMAERALNVFAEAGLGVAGINAKDNPTDPEKKGRGQLRLGGGGELRFDALALSAELRLYGIGENPDVPAVTPETTRYQVARFGVSGIELVFGVTYYF